MFLTIIGINNYHYLRGGSERYFLDLNRLLVEHGHRIIPFSTADTRNVVPEGLHAFVKPINLEHPGITDLARFIYSPHAASVLKGLIRERRPDIAHLHIYYGQLTASILAPLKKAGIPVVQTLHEYKIICPVSTLFSNGQVCQACGGHAFWHATLRRCNRGSLGRSMLSMAESYISKALGSISKIDHFIAVSDFLRNKVTELGVPAEKVTTVHNFLDTSGITPNREPGEYFLYFGRLESLKGVFTLLKAASTLKEVPLLIAGSGKARPELESLIKQNNLRHIELLGFKRGDELHRLIHNSICTLAPSEWYETFGLSLIESFAHGRPVIASSIGGMTEVVSDGIDGFLVPPGDVESLRERMVWMAEHRNKAVEMGLAGRRKVETEFNPEIHYAKIMDVYRKVL